MRATAKVGVVLLVAGLFLLPAFFWLGHAVVYVGIALAALGLLLLLWSGNNAAAAAALGTGGLDDPIDPPDPN